MCAFNIQLSLSPRFLPSARSNLQPLYNWQKTFFTEDKEVVGSVLSGLGYEFEWIEGDMLHYWWVMVSLRGDDLVKPVQCKSWELLHSPARGRAPGLH